MTIFDKLESANTTLNSKLKTINTNRCNRQISYLQKNNPTPQIKFYFGNPKEVFDQLFKEVPNILEIIEIKKLIQLK